MNAGDVLCVCVCTHRIQSMTMYINGGTHAYYERKSIMYTILVKYRPTVAATGPHIIYSVKFSLPKLTRRLSVSEVVEENAIPMCELGLLFAHKLSHVKFEIHASVSAERLQTSKNL